MTPLDPTRLVVELDYDGEGICGRVRDHAGAFADFTGWLGLAAAIEQLAVQRSAARPPPRAA